MRRALLKAMPVVGLLVALTASQLQAAVTPPSEWRQPDADAAHSRANIGERVLSPATVGGLTFDLAIAVAPDLQPDLEWSCQGSHPPRPAVTGTRLFTSYGDGVAAFDTDTGARVWHTTLIGPMTPDAVHVVALHAGRVLVGLSDCVSQSDPSMRVVALDPTSGSVLWTSQADLQGWSTVAAAEHVLVTSGTTVYGEGVHALSTDTGARLWDLESSFCPSDLALVVRRSAIVNTCAEDNTDQVLQARGLHDGAVRWSRPGAWVVERGDSAGPAGQVILAVGATGRLTALDAATGATRWSTAAADHSLAVDAYRVYARCGDSVCALARGNGALLWSQPAPAGDVVVANGVLYQPDGQLRRAGTGALLGRVWSDGHQLLAVADGRVVALDASRRVLDLYGLSN